MIPPDSFPALNATLNGVSAVLILAGYAAVRRRWLRLHVGCMLSAVAVSAAFLASYLYYHAVVRAGVATSLASRWPPEAPEALRYLYYAVLLSHTVLAVFTAPLVLFTAYLGLRGRLARHVRVARWAMPVWLYVSVTGVVVYWMLYRLYPVS